MAQYGHWFFYYITGGLLCPICFLLGVPGPFAFLGLPSPLTLHSHGFLLSSLGFPSPIILSFILEAHGLAINLLLSLLSLLWAYSHFFISYTAHGLLFFFFFFFFLFPGSFKPIYPFKAHLFISWACDPLFLPLGLNGFSIHLPTLFYLCCWASPFHLDFQNGHQQFFFFFLSLYFYCISHPMLTVLFFRSVH